MVEYDPKKTIVVVGYPRSGNTWLTRLIAEILDSPFSRFGDALPIGVEGEDRHGDWLITQLHLRVNCEAKEGRAIYNAWSFNPDLWNGERFLLIYRDPRDVAISAMHYWDLPDVRTALLAMANGKPPLEGAGKWTDFYTPWLKSDKVTSEMRWMISYESLCADPIGNLRTIVPFFDDVKLEKIISAVENQEFFRKKTAILQESIDGIKKARPYGKTIQLKAMRKGVANQWVDETSLEDNQFACQNFKEVMKWMGYPTI